VTLEKITGADRLQISANDKFRTFLIARIGRGLLYL